MVVKSERRETRDGAACRERAGRHGWRNTLKCLERSSWDITVFGMNKLDILVAGLIITYGNCRGGVVSKLGGDIETPDRDRVYANSRADLNPAGPEPQSLLNSFPMDIAFDRLLGAAASASLISPGSVSTHSRVSQPRWTQHSQPHAMLGNQPALRVFCEDAN
jgi:hypothetical protein